MPIPTLPQYLTLSQTLSSQFNPNELDLVYQTTDVIRRWGNLLTLGTIHLSPRGSVVDDFILYLKDVHDIQNISSSTVLEDRPNATSVLIRVHDDEESSTEYVMNNLDERTFVAIDFSEEKNDVSYSLYYKSYHNNPNPKQIIRYFVAEFPIYDAYELNNLAKYKYNSKMDKHWVKHPLSTIFLQWVSHITTNSQRVCYLAC